MTRFVALMAFLGLATPLGSSRADPGDAPLAGDSAVDLGSYERASLQLVLKRLGLKPESSPRGRRVGRVIVENLDVFGEEHGFLRWFNIFHATTQGYIIEREVLLSPGDEWDEELVEETRRRLRDSLFTTYVVVVPVVSKAEDAVDLLVITRDIWSLRPNLFWEYQEGKFIDLSVLISENNFLGLRKNVALVFSMNQGQYSLGPRYIDKNIAGTRLQLTTDWGALFARDGSEFEGTRSTTYFGYPLWSLRSRWGADVVVTHFDSTVRSFEGTRLRTYDNPDTAATEALPFIYDTTTFRVETGLVQQVGKDIKHRFRVGHRLRIRRPTFNDAFPDDPVARDAFQRDRFPRSERSSALFLRHTLFTPTYLVYRDVDTYDLPEDARAGPAVETEVSLALKPLGSEQRFVGLGISASWLFDIKKDGYVQVAAGAGGRVESGDFIDNTLSARVTGTPPRIGNVFRLIGRVSVAQLVDSQANQFLTLGGDSGMRGYQIGAFTGQSRVVGHLEARSMPTRILFSRVGLLAFWDAGHAAERFRDLSLHHDVGLGVRALVPSMQPTVFRFDWALPLNGEFAGFPGRFSAGVFQVF